MNVRKIGKAPKRPLKTRLETHGKWMILFSFLLANYGHWLLVSDVKRIVIVRNLLLNESEMFKVNKLS